MQCIDGTNGMFKIEQPFSFSHSYRLKEMVDIMISQENVIPGLTITMTSSHPDNIQK